MNLLTDPWIPVRCQSGQRRTISPLDLADPHDPPLELDAIRPDFNGALAQFLIGLLQWLAPDNETQWRDIAQGRTPLELDALRELAPCFEFDTGASRFMQDMDFAATEPSDLAGLLLEAPGDNTIKNNADLFVKRREPIALSLPMAVQALLTLQINAPSGGQGHRTSVRGGGPVSMLLWPAQMKGLPVPLWKKAWLNTLVLQGDPPRTTIVFPWMAPCLTSEKGQDVRTLLDAQSPSEIELTMLCYFATARRIRLHFEDEGCCAFSGESGRCATACETRNFGANYRSDLFRHPLSPYYRDAKKNFLPVHVGEIGFTYADWIATQRDTETFRKPAVLESSRLGASLGRTLPVDAIWAFGYEMDNMKCLAWQEKRYRLLNLDDDRLLASVLSEAQRWIDAARKTRDALLRQLRAAWNSGSKGDTSIAELELYALTEQTFYELVNESAALRGDDAALDLQRQELRRRWHRELVRTALHLFERHAERGDVADETMQAIERAAFAHRALLRALNGEVKDVLALDVAERAVRKATAKKRKTA